MALDGDEVDDDDDRDMFCIPPTLWVNADYRHVLFVFMLVLALVLVLVLVLALVLVLVLELVLVLALAQPREQERGVELDRARGGGRGLSGVRCQCAPPSQPCPPFSCRPFSLSLSLSLS